MARVVLNNNTTVGGSPVRAELPVDERGDPVLQPLTASLIGNDHYTQSTSGEKTTEEIRLQPFSFRQAIIAEFFGTFVLITVGCGAIMASSELQSAFNSSGLTSVAMCFGFMVALIGRAFGHVSGAHLNPAVSLACYVTGRLALDRLVAYALAQFVAAFAASAFLYGMVPHALARTMGCTTLAADVSPWQGVCIEATITFNLVFFAFAVSDRAASPESVSLAPILTGLVLSAQIFFAGPLTGASMNPARSFGPAVFAAKWESHWVFWVGPFVGAVLGALSYHYGYQTQPSPPKSSLRTRPSSFFD